MTMDTTCSDALTTAPALDAGETLDAVQAAEAVDAVDGWQALAVASLDRLLTDAELAAVERLPTELALDLLFPDLPDAARQEALWALA